MQITDTDLESFIDGYIECALWADCWPAENDTDGESGGREHLELRDGVREAMAVDCIDFYNHNLADLADYTMQGRPMDHAGHDFWLTRNGHGAGFWDRGLGAVGDRLTRAAKVYGDAQPPYDCGDGTCDI
jgi:hypothetical protein